MSVQIAKVRGIPIKLHFTLIIVFFLITWTLSTSFMPQFFPDLAAAEYWIMGITGAVILFASVLLHELAHSIVASNYGFKVRQIVLFIFGGVSDIAEEPKDFRREFKIAIVGPATSFALAAGFAALWFLMTALTASLESAAARVAEGVFLYGAIINALLGAFNLIPAFPLDGGRVLRAALIRWNKNYDEATRISARVGIYFSYAFMGIGFVMMFTGAFFSGIWILLIGWFLHSGAQSYLSQHEITQLLSNVRLRDIMNTKVIAVSKDVSVDALLRDFFGTYMKSAFPVVGHDGRLAGMVTLKDIKDVPPERRQHVTANDVMVQADDLVVMSPDRKADEALMKMVRKQAGRVFVLGQDGELIGLVSKTDIMNVASERKDYREELKRAALAGESLQRQTRTDSEAA